MGKWEEYFMQGLSQATNMWQKQIENEENKEERKKEIAERARIHKEDFTERANSRKEEIAERARLHENDLKERVEARKQQKENAAAHMNQVFEQVKRDMEKHRVNSEQNDRHFNETSNQRKQEFEFKKQQTEFDRWTKSIQQASPLEFPAIAKEITSIPAEKRTPQEMQKLTYLRGLYNSSRWNLGQKTHRQKVKVKVPKNPNNPDEGFIETEEFQEIPNPNPVTLPDWNEAVNDNSLVYKAFQPKIQQPNHSNTLIEQALGKPSAVDTSVPEKLKQAFFQKQMTTDDAKLWTSLSKFQGKAITEADKAAINSALATLAQKYIKE